jgi:putative ABC transport system permease protein
MSNRTRGFGLHSILEREVYVQRVGFVSQQTALGIALGYLMGAGLLALMAPIFTQFIHLQIGAPVVEPTLIFVTVTLGVGVTLLAGLLPAFSASRVMPLEALRPSVAEIGQRTAGAGAVIGACLIALAGLGLISGNMGLTALGGLMFDPKMTG